MLTVHMLGLMYFNACHGSDRRVMLPDGTEGVVTVLGDDGIPHPVPLPRHYASLFVQPRQLLADDWWPEDRFDRPIRVEFARDDVPVQETRHILEFRISRKAEIVVGGHRENEVDLGNLTRLPKLQDMDDQFEADVEYGETIAQMPLTGGRVNVYKFLSEGVVKWTVAELTGPVSITAFTDGGESRSIMLRDIRKPAGAEVVFINAPDLLGRGGGHGAHAQPPGEKEPQHYWLFGKINVSRKNDKFQDQECPYGVGDLVSNHDYLSALALLARQIPEPGCTPTCC
jgi:hypothetical protein